MTNSLNEKKKEIKKINAYYIIIIILSLLIMIIGISFSYFTAVSSQEKDKTRINTGTLIVNFVDGIEISNPLLIPRNAPSNVNDKSYLYTNTFSVENTGSLEQTLDVYLNITTNEFTTGSLKYKVYNSNNQLMKEGNISKNGDTKILENRNLNPSNKETYTLMIWLQETGTIQNNDQSKSLIGTMRAEATQVRK